MWLNSACELSAAAAIMSWNFDQDDKDVDVDLEMVEIVCSVWAKNYYWEKTLFLPVLIMQLKMCCDVF